MKSLINALKNKHTLVFIDFEGTQFGHEIIASGLVKCHIDDNGKILSFDEKGLLIYTKPRTQIGKIVTSITSLTEEFIKEHGISWGETINEIENYIGEDMDDTIFVCFGPNDLKMVADSCQLSHPENASKAKRWLSNFFDIMTFFSQYIRDPKGNTYSLVNFLKVFGIESVGNSHNPLNDAYDLMHLYEAFLNNPDIVFNEYLKQLNRIRLYPCPIKEVITELINGKTITSQMFYKIVKDYLE